MDHKDNVRKHYDAASESYSNQYERDSLYDTEKSYPANYFRMQLLLNSFLKSNVRKVIEVGVGEGTPLATLASAGIDVWGFDISKKMVEKSKAQIENLGLSPQQISLGDIEDPATYVHLCEDGLFDAAIAMGVMPHVKNDEFVLKNIGNLVKEGGKVFIEFRNKLFSMFTFNRYTYEFIVEDLLDGVDKHLVDTVRSDLESKLRMDLPPQRLESEDGSAPGYDAILSKFHNPLEMPQLFSKCGFTDVQLLWYHYHPSLPYLESNNKELFRKEAIRLEHETSGWKGYFLCSAFVVEAKKVGTNE